MTSFELGVQRVGQICLFNLRWEGERRLEVRVPFPESLLQRYDDWQRTYRSFYQTLPISLKPSEPGSGLRGKPVGGGSVVATPNDWHGRLVQAEHELLHTFHRWLRHPNLYEIRAEIANASRAADAVVDIFLTCSPEIARLPWEAWEIARDFAASGNVRIARTPEEVRVVASHSSRRRPRVLAILGDDTGLDFREDRRAVQALTMRAEVVFVGWQPGADVETLKTQIIEAIADERGWDILFFAGHSNEKAGLGGELAIAPNTAITLKEIAPYLRQAQQRGLQFAIFNSCKGMDIAAALIGLGLSQAAVMREPIHNRVAHLFLPQFLQRIADYQDVHTALVTATESLKKAEVTYPSAALVLSLFRHPGAPLFQLQPYGWRQRLQKLRPTIKEAIALGLLAAISWPLPVQSWLLERRILNQARYRHLMGRIEPAILPPVMLIQIDEASLKAANIEDRHPIDRQYLAEVIEALASYQPSVVGVDYLLDRPQGETEVLAQVVKEANSQGVEFVFAAHEAQGQWNYALPQIANGSRAGNIDLRNHHLTRVSAGQSDPSVLAYVLVNLYRPESLTARSVQNPLTSLSYDFEQRWLDPIMDFSVPITQVYDTLSAKTLLENESLPPQLAAPLDQQIVIVAPGGYAEAGITPGQDNLPAPLALRYWYGQREGDGPLWRTTGSEIHAYQIHHFLRQRLVIPIPDLWLILIAALLAKVLLSQRRWNRRPLGPKELAITAGLAAGYALLSLELYLSPAAILLPIVLPVATACSYVLLRYLSSPSTP
ncbi:MAG: CHASE2 domain-containing protein [Cyanobacteria bacterium P01_A01_bin.135]